MSRSERRSCSTSWMSQRRLNSASAADCAAAARSSTASPAQTWESRNSSTGTGGAVRPARWDS